MNSLKQYLLAVEFALAMILPLVCALALPLALIGFAGSVWPLFMLWLLWGIAGWIGLIGALRLGSMVCGAPKKYDPTLTLSMLVSGLIAWGIFSYFVFNGTKGIFPYWALLTFPVVFHFLYLARRQFFGIFTRD